MGNDAPPNSPLLPKRRSIPKRPYIERGHVRNYSNLTDTLRRLFHTPRVTPSTWCTSMSLWHFFHDHAECSHLQPYYFSFIRLSDHFDTLVSSTFPLAGLKCLNLPRSIADTPLPFFSQIYQVQNTSNTSLHPIPRPHTHVPFMRTRSYEGQVK